MCTTIQNSKYSDLCFFYPTRRAAAERPDSRALQESKTELFMSVYVSVYKEVDLLLESNNSEHHTADISVDQLIVRRGQSFTVSLTLVQPFNGNLHPLTITATTGEAVWTGCLH